MEVEEEDGQVLLGLDRVLLGLAGQRGMLQDLEAAGLGAGAFGG
jgi:hypothetical protein